MKIIPTARKPDLTDQGDIAAGQGDDSIDLQEPRTVRYWTETLGVSEEQLHTAVEHAGASVEEVRKYLGSHS
ncbi:DUF3606 domain-containing protein [Caulobacter hibisci]|uniref:DUF3606 domain-containing protein n=2 Tax=Caulobacter hibisci TaxID=2035993 RepID=A0ABS0STF2_9CAUL|nr:DUF3606 domain-containing protein [Caulobacter hibisci]